MGTFFNHPPQKLVAGRSGSFDHWFGGPPRHRGVVPAGRKYPVHLLYDLDLRDPALGLASRFEGLTRLPVLNALQYNCCDMVYRVVSDDEVRIVDMSNPKNADWIPDHPYENYPASFPRRPVVVEPTEQEILDLLGQVLADDGTDGSSYTVSRPIHDRLAALGYPYPQVGGAQFMWQGIPEWDCVGARCPFAGAESSREVIAVIWERPSSDVHLWSNSPEYQNVGSLEIIISRCVGCGALHSCNRCD